MLLPVSSHVLWFSPILPRLNFPLFSSETFLSIWQNSLLLSFYFLYSTDIFFTPFTVYFHLQKIRNSPTVYHHTDNPFRILHIPSRFANSLKDIFWSVVTRPNSSYSTTIAFGYIRSIRSSGKCSSKNAPISVCTPASPLCLCVYRFNANPDIIILKIINTIIIQLRMIPVFFGIFSIQSDRRGYKSRIHTTDAIPQKKQYKRLILPPRLNGISL